MNGRESVKRKEPLDVKLSEIYDKLISSKHKARFKGAFLNKFTSFGGAPRKHEILIEYLKMEEDVDVRDARSILGYSERYHVYRAMAELIPRKRFVKIFKNLKVVNDLTQRRPKGRIVVLMGKVGGESMKYLKTATGSVKAELKERFARSFREKYEDYFDKTPLGDPEVYISTTMISGEDFLAIAFSFPKQHRQSLWKNRTETQHVPSSVRFWISKKRGEISTSETSVQHRVFPLISEILAKVLDIRELGTKKLKRNDKELQVLISEGSTGQRPIKKLDLQSKDTNDIERIEIVGENVLKRLQSILGERTYKELLKQMRILYISDGLRGFSEVEQT